MKALKWASRAKSELPHAARQCSSMNGVWNLDPPRSYRLFQSADLTIRDIQRLEFAGTSQEMEMTDFFISYTGSDKKWAEWIAFILEEAGFTTILQGWDFRPGSNFVLEMQEASSAAERTIMVLSPDYLKSGMAAAEWASAFARDPQGLNRRVVPVMVHNCKPEGLLTAIVQIRIVGMDEVVARQAILDGVDMKRAKPSNRPSFPGAPLAPEHKDFPGVESAPARSVRDLLPRLHATATDADRRRFAKGAFAAIRKTFEDNLKQAAEENDRVDFDLTDATATD